MLSLSRKDPAKERRGIFGTSFFSSRTVGRAPRAKEVTPAPQRGVLASSQLKVVGADDCYSNLVALENSGQLLRDRLLAVVQDIAYDAMETGARELYIGHPREYRYEFFIDDTGYQGAIQPSHYFALLKLFGDETELEFPLDWPDVEALRLSLTSNYLNPVIHVSWRYRWVDQPIQEEYLDQLI